LAEPDNPPIERSTKRRKLNKPIFRHDIKEISGLISLDDQHVEDSDPDTPQHIVLRKGRLALSSNSSTLYTTVMRLATQLVMIGVVSPKMSLPSFVATLNTKDILPYWQAQVHQLCLHHLLPQYQHHHNHKQIHPL
jgi:hypothetical protein